MLFTRQELKARRKDAKKRGIRSGWSDVEIAHKVYYEGTELEPGACGLSTDANPVTSDQEAITVALKGSRSLLIPKADIAGWHVLRAADIPGFTVGKRQVLEGALVAGALGAAAGRAEEAARAELPAIGITYTHKGDECNVYLAFARQKEYQKMEQLMVKALGAAATTN